MTRVWGVMALRLANADIVPLDYRATARAIRGFVTETVDAAADRDRASLAPLGEALARFDAAAAAAGTRIDTLLAHDAPNRAATTAIDRMLIRTERAFLDPDGIPNRPWYRHLVYAPKATYAPEVLPGITEAMESGDRARVEREVAKFAAALTRASAALPR
jgi:N-acetylated-alpha-linked acidic dipeptidase